MQSSPDPGQPSRRALIALEHARPTASTLEQVLREGGYAVTSGSAQTALQAARAEEFDVVFVDVSGALTGELVRAARERTADPVVILVRLDERDDAETQKLRLGADLVIEPPVAPEELTELLERSIESRQPVSIPDRPRVMVVDDEDFVLEVVRDTLIEQYEVAALLSPEEALRRLKDEPYEILITDLVMGEMDGMDLLRLAKTIRPSIVGLIMTGFASKESAVAALKEGAYDLLEKPFSPDTLEQAVERAWRSVRMGLENRRLLQELRRANQEISSAHQALIESEGRFRQFAQHVQEVFWMSDTGFTEVVYVSPAYAEIWGRSCESLMAQPRSFLEAIHPDDRQRVRIALDPHPSPDFDEEFRVVRPDGTERLVWARAFPVRDHIGETYRIAGVAQDITKRRRDEDQRRQFAARIQHTQKLESLGVLAGGTAHDFNNLLGGILGNADLAMNELAADSPARHSVEQIQKTAMRAAEITRQLLAYSGKSKFIVQPVDVNRLVREMGNLLDLSITKMAKLRYSFTEELPSVMADATRLRQVVMNLIINASEALGDTGGVITLRTGLVELDREYLDQAFLGEMSPGQHVYLEVADTGSGMDAETLKSIFDPFYTTKFTGRGLGLAAVQGIVRSHDGGMEVSSQPNKGARFRVLLPVCAEEAEDEPESGEAGGGLPRDWRGSGTVLVVEDEASVQRVACRALSEAGFDVVAADDGIDGVEKYFEHQEKIRFVLLDLTLPGLSGEQVFGKIQAEDPDVKVILCSGYTAEEASSRFPGENLVGFLEKPYRPAGLLAMARTLMEDEQRSQRTRSGR